MVTEPEVLTRMMEEPIDPELPICDPHHHLWDRPARENRPGNRYLLEELLQDIGDSHNIIQTVFVECRSTLLPNRAFSHSDTFTVSHIITLLSYKPSYLWPGTS